MKGPHSSPSIRETDVHLNSVDHHQDMVGKTRILCGLWFMATITLVYSTDSRRRCYPGIMMCVDPGRSDIPRPVNLTSSAK